MQRVGGYRDWLALLQDERDLDDVMLVMAGEAEANRILAMRRKAGS